jgi:hypothetical protein
VQLEALKKLLIQLMYGTSSCKQPGSCYVNDTGAALVSSPPSLSLATHVQLGLRSHHGKHNHDSQDDDARVLATCTCGVKAQSVRQLEQCPQNRLHTAHCPSCPEHGSNYQTPTSTGQPQLMGQPTERASHTENALPLAPHQQMAPLALLTGHSDAFGLCLFQQRV